MRQVQKSHAQIIHIIFEIAAAVMFSDCPSLSAPSHGALNSSDTTIGTCVSVTCEEGCTRIGPPELTCGSDGHWDPQEMPECVESMYM